ncbi:hypothetical protein R50072_22150 [Simiduia litorea]|uniref:hypothetical protein n=1 Tax=Simiduia litorea TaxID=1435348 RepID=UPI0036F34D0A
MSDRQPGKQGLFELVVVLVVIALTAATGARYIMKAIDEAWQVSIETQAQVFTAAVALVHWRWVSGGASSIHGKNREMAYVEVDGVRIFLNRFGWPVHTEYTLSESGLQAEGCLQVWNAVLQNPGNARLLDQPIVKNSDIQVQVVEGKKCRYGVYTKSNTEHYFDYDVTSGRVEVASGQNR